MLRASRVLRDVVKKTTGLVGLDVVPNAREVLIELYEQTLKAVQVRLPPPTRSPSGGHALVGGGWARAGHA